MKKRYRSLHDLVAAQPRNLTQGDIARMLGLSEAMLSNVLSGKRRLGADNALRISKRWGIPLENILNPKVAA